MNLITTEDYITENLDSFEQIEHELDITINKEQRIEIAQIARDGVDFYEAFDKVVG